MDRKLINSLSSYDFEVPAELIAQEPPTERGASRLLVLERTTGALRHLMFTDIIDFLSPGDCLVLNRTKVIPARLHGRKETGGKVEVLFLTFPEHNAAEVEALALVKPSMAPGKNILLPGGLTARVEGKTELGETLRLSGPSLMEVLKEHGHMPLPPYIKRDKENDSRLAADRERYQTVYAKEGGSIAAPTAGLHFTDGLIDRIKAKGVTIAEVLLHVGWGTFRPVVSEDITRHVMLPEFFELTPDALQTINTACRSKRSVVAVGTTTVRALESAYVHSTPGRPDTLPDEHTALQGHTTLFIYPGYPFRIVSRFSTNLHLPHSTPLFMVSAFAGKENILRAYDEAIQNKYRFFSYGDAMLIL